MARRVSGHRFAVQRFCRDHGGGREIHEATVLGGAKVEVAGEGSGDDGFGQAHHLHQHQAQPFRSMQGNEGVATCIKLHQFRGGNCIPKQVDPGVIRRALLEIRQQFFSFRTNLPVRHLDHQVRIDLRFSAWKSAFEGLNGRHGVFAAGVAVHIESGKKQHPALGQAKLAPITAHQRPGMMGLGQVNHGRRKPRVVHGGFDEPGRGNEHIRTIQRIAPFLGEVRKFPKGHVHQQPIVVRCFRELWPPSGFQFRRVATHPIHHRLHVGPIPTGGFISGNAPRPPVTRVDVDAAQGETVSVEVFDQVARCLAHPDVGGQVAEDIEADRFGQSRVHSSGA